MARVTNSASGNPASFRSPGSVPIRSLKIHFNPVQDFNGYGKPWVGGAGKNLLKGRTPGSMEIHGATFTSNNDGTITIIGNPTNASGLNINTAITLPAGNYILSGCPIGGSNNTFNLNTYNGISIEDYGNGVSFTLTEETTFKVRISWVANAQLDGLTFYPMIRLASNNDATWEPYENICPITGWTGISYSYSNKNILPAKVPSDAIKGTFSTGSTSISSASNAICFSVYVGKNRQLKFSKKINGSLMFAFTDNKVVDRTQTIYSAVNCANRESYTFNSGDHPWLLINSSSKSGYESFTDATAPIMRFSEDSTDYVPRIDWIPKSVNWANEAGELFGGYIDIISGDLIATHKKVVLNDASKWVDYSSYRNYQYNVEMTDRLLGVNNTIISTIAPKNTAGVEWYIRWNVGSTGYIPTLMWPSGASPMVTFNELKALSENGDIAICYPLAEPIVYHLTPQGIISFTTNKIWSNTDSLVEIEYDYAESIDILKMRGLMIANVPHIETINTTNKLLEFNTIVPNAIKECKISFNPMQDGSGEPSPTNIRDIVGWTNIMVTPHNDEINHTHDATDVDTIAYGMHVKSENHGRHVTVIGTATRSSTFNLNSADSNGGTLYLSGFTPFNDNVWWLKVGTQEILRTNNLNGVSFSGYEEGTIVNYRFDYSSGITYNIDNYPIATTYQPITVNWSSTAGTLYGGYIDLISGKLVATYKKVVLNDSTKWTRINSGDFGFYVYQVQMSDRKGYKEEVISNIAPRIEISEATDIWHVQFNSSAGYYPCFVWNDKTVTPPVTLDQLKTITSNGDVSICYPLKVPIEYQLTPQIIMQFIGQNKIWSSANGGIEIKYWTH